MTLNMLARWAVLGAGLVGGVSLLGVAWSLSAAPRPWSDPATWAASGGAGGHVPLAGETVTIPAGMRVRLDMSPPPLAALHVAGELVLDDAGLTLRAGEITVSGRVEAGSARHPLKTPTTLELGGGGHSGTLGVLSGGVLELRGQVRLPWTRLADDAPAGSRTLTLAQPSDWQAGDRLVLAPSGYDPEEAETLTVAAAAPDGRTLTLAGPLRYTHSGPGIPNPDSPDIDERAEVGLLSHTLRVRGAPDDAASGQAGGVMVMRGGTLHASDTEFTALGGRGKLGRYPVHFHLAGDAAGSFVQRSSIHDTFNRCVTLHGSDHVRLAQNVMYASVGHCVFLEDGNERQNLLEGNLAVLTRPAAPGEAILDTDAQPSLYWIANPDNVLHGNVAAGAPHSGFWYNLSEHGSGPGAAPTLWPRRTPLGGFYGNVSHSNTYNGLFVDNLKNPPGVSAPPNYEPTTRAVFRGLTAYSNRRRGVWLRGRNLEVTGAQLADNAVGATFAAADAALTSSVVVGQSEQAVRRASGPPKPDRPATPIIGFEFYDGPVQVSGTRFVNFVGNAARPAGALGALRFSPFFTHPGSAASGLSFQAAQPVYLEPRLTPPVPGPGGEDQGADGYRSTVFVDQDGSVGGLRGASLALDNDWLRQPDCTAQPLWGALVCPEPFGSLFVANLDAAPGVTGPLTLTRDSGAQLTLRGNPREGANTSFQTNLTAGQRYRLRLGGGVGGGVGGGLGGNGLPGHLRLALHHLPAGQAAELLLENVPASVQLSVGRERPAPLALSPDRASYEAQAASGPGDAAWLDGHTLHLCLRSQAQPGGAAYGLIDVWRAGRGNH